MITQYYVCKSSAKLQLNNKQYTYVYYNQLCDILGPAVNGTDFILVEDLTDEELTILALADNFVMRAHIGRFSTLLYTIVKDKSLHWVKWYNTDDTNNANL